MNFRIRGAAAALLLAVAAAPALADRTHVAVAANFTDAANEIAAAFKADTGHDAVLSFGSTAQLYTQITQDAPFEVFLSADPVRPKKAIDEGFGVAGSDFTYAVGKLVLWSATADFVKGVETLEEGKFDKLAIASPEAAPYGAAAVEAMRALGVYDTLSARIVQGNNISQAYQFVGTGNAELGFVALSQVAGKTEGSQWLVPADLYRPILQDAVLLRKGEGKAAATAFLDYLKGPEAGAIIGKYGYGVESAN